MLQITHTWLGGTAVEGTTRGDGSSEILRSLGWRWSRHLALWFVPRSRDHRGDARRIEAAREALESAGLAVTVSIDDRRPSMADVESARAVRQEGRAAALGVRAERAQQKTAAAFEAAHAAIRRLPEGGEPIHVGHHSEGRHRNAIAKADRAIATALHTQAEQELAESRAAAAAVTTRARYTPSTVANRIRKLEADIRAAQRDVAGGRDSAWVARRQEDLDHMREDLAYWQSVRSDQVAAGKATSFTRADVHPGDRVRVGQRWHEVIRVNATTVTLAGEFGRGRVPFSDLRAVSSAGQE